MFSAALLNTSIYKYTLDTKCESDMSEILKSDTDFRKRYHIFGIMPENVRAFVFPGRNLSEIFYSFPNPIHWNLFKFHTQLW